MTEPIKKPELCMFCGGDESLGPMNTEHFVPKCLWAGPRPSGTKTLPAHVACNNSFADDNDYFRTIVVADDSANEHAQARQLRETKLKRMIDNRPGQWSRYTKGQKIRPRYTRSGIYLGHKLGFPLDMAKINRVVGNILKGIFYTMCGRPLLQTTRIIVEIPEGENDPVYKPLTEVMGNWGSFGDDVFRFRVAVCEDIENMACLMSFYRHKFFFARTEELHKSSAPIPYDSAVILG